MKVLLHKNLFSQDPDEFFFESDHLALRNNKDYQKLLRAYILLSAQKDEMLKNYDTLNAALTLSQEKPVEFVSSLRSGELKLPDRITLVNIPKIDLQQYENKVPEYLLNKAKSIYNDDKQQSTSNEKIDSYHLTENRHSAKSDKLWTVAEQRRLEELLVEFPSEEVEMRRFAKIAKALGNRTTKQVASRIQKYFIKLHKAGLPVPGRLPRMRPGKRSLKNSVFYNSFSLIKPSTFFPTLTIPNGLQSLHNQNTQNVIPQVPKEISEVDNYTDDEVTESDTNSDDSTNENDTMTVDKYSLRILKRVLKDKQKDDSRPYSIHVRHTCDFCKESPIIGTRWHCMDCRNRSIDFCSDCFVAQTEDLEKVTHPLSHNVVPFRSKSDNKSKDIKPTVIKEETIKTDNDTVTFTPKIEADYFEYLTKKFQNKEVTSETFINEMLSLNFGKCNLVVQEDKLSTVSAQDFFKDKTIMNIFKHPDLHNNIFVDCDESVNVKLLKSIDKDILNSNLDLSKPKVISELLDHDYSFNCEEIEVKEEKEDKSFDDNITRDDKNDCGVINDGGDLHNYLLVNEEMINIGREEFV
ncbi:ZZ-type zinc finger-containing protein 3-like [Ctenocephalides felis]|uniref:ZZ-type zinc finger-containing protein 3-like n=1 Tax=Ctenocephalides felis TaxID=7515 RepID=UPI000E6E58CB|nr:ZZ-type zinc finger-containing protein 3-like [Ctenocephalides felis]